MTQRDLITIPLFREKGVTVTFIPESIGDEMGPRGAALYETYAGEDEGYREKLEHARAIIEEEVATLRRLVGEFSVFAAEGLGEFFWIQVVVAPHQSRDYLAVGIIDEGFDHIFWLGLEESTDGLDGAYVGCVDILHWWYFGAGFFFG